MSRTGAVKGLVQLFEMPLVRSYRSAAKAMAMDMALWISIKKVALRLIF